MWNKIPINERVIVAVWNCKVYQGIIIANTKEQITLTNVEVYELGKITTTYMLDNIVIDKGDIEVMAQVKVMQIKERLE